MRISDWSSDVCSSDLREPVPGFVLDFIKKHVWHRIVFDGAEMNANTFVIFADLEVDFEIGRSLVFIALICPDDDVRPGRFGKDLGDRNILESEFFGTATDRETRDIERMRMAFDQRSKFEKDVCHGGATTGKGSLSRSGSEQGKSPKHPTEGPWILTFG